MVAVWSVQRLFAESVVHCHRRLSILRAPIRPPHQHRRPCFEMCAEKERENPTTTLSAARVYYPRVRSAVAATTRPPCPFFGTAGFAQGWGLEAGVHCPTTYWSMSNTRAFEGEPNRPSCRSVALLLTSSTSRRTDPPPCLSRPCSKGPQTRGLADPRSSDMHPLPLHLALSRAASCRKTHLYGAGLVTGGPAHCEVSSLTALRLSDVRHTIRTRTGGEQRRLP
jgi:hypothetical protein